MIASGARGLGRLYDELVTRRNRFSRMARTVCHSGRSAKAGVPSVVTNTRSGSRLTTASTLTWADDV